MALAEGFPKRRPGNDVLAEAKKASSGTGVAKKTVAKRAAKAAAPKAAATKAATKTA